MNNLPKARTENIVIQDTETELLIYDLVSNKVLCLNETSKSVWQACDGKTTFDDFRKKTNLEFSDELIWLALDQLKRDNLFDKNIEIEVKFNGLTRREVVRKIGVASMVALPIISSIVAPSATMAQSVADTSCLGGPAGTIPLGDNCVTPCQCVTPPGSPTCCGFFTGGMCTVIGVVTCAP